MEKINNRICQIKYATYKKRADIIITIKKVRKYVNMSTYKFLEYFTKTEGGVTQAKIKTICEKIKIAYSTYHQVVKRELLFLFDEPLVLFEAAPLKQGKGKKVRASEFKILQPMKKIEQLIAKKEAEENQELIDFIEMEEIKTIPEADTEIIPESETKISENPCPPKVEKTKTSKQYNSFRKNLLVKIYNLKLSVKTYLKKFSLFKDFLNWHPDWRQGIGQTLQLAIINAKADINNPKTQAIIKSKSKEFQQKYFNVPDEEFFGLYYTCIYNAIKSSERPSVAAKKSKEIIPEWLNPAEKHHKDSLDDKPFQENSLTIEEMLEQLALGHRF